ncbi:MAG: hypothetical protein IKG46_11045 [Solobacterium sp.]|nr:hypothetical protein [Solobacterium sp.]
MKNGFSSTFMHILRIVLSAGCVWFGIHAPFPLALLYYAAAVFTFPYFQSFFDSFLKQRMILPLLSACLLLSAVVLQNMTDNKVTGPLFEKDDVIRVEYRQGKADPLDYVTVYYPNTTSECSTMLDLSRTGTQKIGCRFTLGRRTEEAELVFEVTDTVSPLITFFEDSVTLYEHSDYNERSNIASVMDPIDGTLEYLPDADMPSAGTYTVRTSGDITVPGTYTVYVTAADRNGNVSSASCEYIIMEDRVVEETEPQDPAEEFTGLDPNMEIEELIRYIRLLYLLEGEEIPEEVNVLLERLQSGDIDAVDFLELLIRITQ